MRRRDREITDKQDILEVMRKCDVCRIALHDGDYPYIVPLNFGLQVENDMPVLYFHGALEGKKYELIEKDNRASFEMDCGHQLVLDKARETAPWSMKVILVRDISRCLTKKKSTRH